MDLARVRREVAEAQQAFSYVEAHPTQDGKLFVLVALQTSQNRIYTLAIHFPDTYPNAMPTVLPRKPTIDTGPHRYTNGNVCYLLPAMWNPGRHNLTFVIARIAKWLGKHEVWLATGVWPGAEVKH